MSSVQSSEELEKLINEKSSKLVEGGQEAGGQQEEEEINRSTFSGTPYADPEAELPLYTGDRIPGTNDLLLDGRELMEKYDDPSVQEFADDLFAGRIVPTPKDVEDARHWGLAVQELMYLQSRPVQKIIQTDYKRAEKILTAKDKGPKLTSDFMVKNFPHLFTAKELRAVSGRQVKGRPTDIDRFNKSAMDLKDTMTVEDGLESSAEMDEAFEEYRKAALGERLNAENSKAIKMFGEDVVRQAAGWALENLSEYEISQMSTYDVVRRMVESGNSNLTSDQIGRFFDKNGELKPSIANAFSAPLRRPDADHYASTGNIREQGEAKKVKTSRPLPTEKELAGMTSEEISKFLKFKKNPGW